MRRKLGGGSCEEEAGRRKLGEGSCEEEAGKRTLGGSWEQEAVRRKLGGIMEEASWMRNRGGDIMEEASWRRAWLARGGLRPGGVSGQKQCVLGCVFMVNVNYARGKPARELPRGHALSVFITLLAGRKWDGRRDGNQTWFLKSCVHSPPVNEQGRPFAKAFRKNMYRCGYRPLIGKSSKRCTFLLV